MTQIDSITALFAGPWSHLFLLSACKMSRLCRIVREHSGMLQLPSASNQPAFKPAGSRSFWKIGARQKITGINRRRD